jgi:hypothetical protein
MAEAELTPNQLVAIRQVWDHFKSSGEWPTRQRILITLDEQGIDLDAEVVSLRGASGGGGSGSDARVSLDWTLAVGVPEVRDLLEPLPKLVARALERLLTGDPFSGVQLDQADFSSIWGSGEKGALAHRVIKATGVSAVPWSSASESRGGFSLTVDLRVLRYEHAGTLDELLAVNPHGERAEVGQHPHGKHRLLLKAIHQHLVDALEWPVAVPLAIENRALGYVPDFLDDLHPTFVRNSFGHSPHHRLSLTPRAIAVVDDDGKVRGNVLTIFHTCADIWKRWPEKEPIPLSEVARQKKVSVESLVPAAEYLDWGKWCTVSHGEGKGNLGLVVNEKVRHARDVSSWDSYWATYHADEKPSDNWAPSLQRRAELEAVTPRSSTPFDGIASLLTFLLRDDLRTTATAELSQAVEIYKVRAWKMCLVAAGSIAETVLLDVTDRSPVTAASYIKGGKWPDRAGLADMLGIALDEGLINESTRTMGRLIADYRNLVHPNRARSQNVALGEQEARAAATFLHTLVANLMAAAESGALTRYEQKG